MKCSVLLILLCACALYSQEPDALHPGPLSDGSTLLSTGWRVNPAGKEVLVGGMPMTSVLSPDGKFLVVLNAGDATLAKPGNAAASLSVLMADTLVEQSRVRAPDAADGTKFQAWKGLVFSADGRRLYVGGGASNTVYEFSFSATGALGFTKAMRAALTAPGPNDFIGDVAIPPGGRLVYAADLFHDRIVVFNPQSGAVIDRFKSGRRPYQILFHPDGKSYFVSSWADATVYQYSTASGQELNRIRVAQQPMGMVLSDRKVPDDSGRTKYRLFVAAANTNNVYAISIDDSSLMSQTDVLDLAFRTNLPFGTTPTALALSPDQTKLLVACSGINTIVVADISESRSHLIGYLPVGSFPSSVTVLPGARVLATNAFGDGTTGSLSMIENVLTDKDEAHLAELTDQQLALFPAILDTDVAQRVDHVVYISQETTVGTTPSPTAAKLAREFVAVRNYAPNTAKNADAVYWSLAGMPPAFTRLAPDAWVQSGKLEGGEPANLVGAGYLWSNLASAGGNPVNYGLWTEKTGGEAHSKEPSLEMISDPDYPVPSDTTISDADRVRRIGEDLKQWVADREMPNLVMIRFAGNDDAALGSLVQQISSSPFWRQTAIFVEGTSAAPLLVISPYSRGAKLDGEFYNSSSVLRTMELILKLRPISIYDAAARPLSGAFSASSDTKPFLVQ
ncbi:MAG: bifunctional YncE family protein/alkaline phosphatase family protein [Acidobacteriota bacterium]